MSDTTTAALEEIVVYLTTARGVDADLARMLMGKLKEVLVEYAVVARERDEMLTGVMKLGDEIRLLRLRSEASPTVTGERVLATLRDLGPTTLFDCYRIDVTDDSAPLDLAVGEYLRAVRVEQANP